MSAKKSKRAEQKDQKASTRKNITANAENDFSVVGIGASAGGLEAIEGLFSNIPVGLNIAFVIIQHLSPDHKSFMSSLLEKYTKMKIIEIVDGTRIEPNCVYLNSPDKDVSVMNRRLYLLAPTQARGTRRPIDQFFSSLAENRGGKSICIVLSGTGTDGTLGLKAIKEAGGMAIAQKESQAQYANMPRSAIGTGLVDFVLPVEEMGSEIIKYIKNPYIKGIDRAKESKEKFEKYLQKILMLVRSSTGHDFSHYKTNTINRRIERRMAVHQIEKVSEYVLFLQKNDSEIKMLFKDFLITVTDFFRDPEAFESLNDKVISPLLEERPCNANIRVWVPGCASGEEAYSIAILLYEKMQDLKKDFNIQIFATDIDADSIEHGRRGVYPESIASHVSPERLKRFFTKNENTYKIKKQIREMVVFAVQNLTKDAPFSKLDLICCRNLLIYMDSTLQKKAMSLFQYTLNPWGFLFLGTSETIGAYSGNFSLVDTKWKIFKRKETIADIGIGRPVTSFHHINPKHEMPEIKSAPTADNIRQLAERSILQSYAPPCILINQKFDILYFHGATDQYLSLPKGEPKFNILKMAREGIRNKMIPLLHKAGKEKAAAASEWFQVNYNNEIMIVKIVVRPVLEQVSMEGFMMVTFESRKPARTNISKKQNASAGKSDDSRVMVLENELQSAKEYLQTTIEELETSNEELKSTNEELQSTNEELQSSNEELETSREELQSTNEELETVNAELQKKLEQLSAANDDLNNLMFSTEIATVFLDNDMRIKRFTPKMRNLFKLIDTDIGRSVGDIVHNLINVALLEDINQVIDHLGRVEKEVQSSDGRWYLMRILPYRTVDNAIDGVVIAFPDITVQVTNELLSIEARNFAEGIIATVRESLVVLDNELRVISANESFYKTFKTEPKDTEKKLIYELGNGQWDIGKLRQLLEEILPKNTQFRDLEIVHDFPDIGQKKMLLNALRISHSGKSTETILLAIADVTSRRESD